MKSDNNPKAADISALKEIIAGTPADALTIKRLTACDLVQELNGTAILTDKGLQTAVTLMADATEENAGDAQKYRKPKSEPRNAALSH
jgi:S1-C subfamily serine protease